MVVDDEKGCTELLRRMLEQMGHQKIEAVSASNVLKRLHAEPYDLLFLDYGMRELQGDVVCRYIRQDAALKTLPIIIVTGYDHLTAPFFKSFGANDVLYKPVEYDNLKRIIQPYLKAA